MNELTTVEVNRLESLERTIERGMKSFLEVGAALCEINSKRLYRAQYETFEAYCREKWDFSAARGRQLMSAVEAIASLPDDLPRPTNASQAQELAKVPEDLRADVWMDALNEAESEDRDVTAADIRESARLVEDDDDEDFEDDDEEVVSMGEANIAETNPIVRDVLEKIRAASDAAEKLIKTSASAWLLVSGTALLKHLRDAKDHVNAAKPAGVCPACSGSGCGKCFEVGWVNRSRLDSLAPKKR